MDPNSSLEGPLAALAMSLTYHNEECLHLEWITGEELLFRAQIHDECYTVHDIGLALDRSDGGRVWADAEGTMVRWTVCHHCVYRIEFEDTGREIVPMRIPKIASLALVSMTGFDVSRQIDPELAQICTQGCNHNTEECVLISRLLSSQRT